ncbi:hypothetical protein V6Z11_D09G208800 [Gossypium hirsutum]
MSNGKGGGGSNDEVKTQLLLSSVSGNFQQNQHFNIALIRKGYNRGNEEEHKELSKITLKGSGEEREKVEPRIKEKRDSLCFSRYCIDVSKFLISSFFETKLFVG